MEKRFFLKWRSGEFSRKSKALWGVNLNVVSNDNERKVRKFIRENFRAGDRVSMTELILRIKKKHDMSHSVVRKIVKKLQREGVLLLLPESEWLSHRRKVQTFVVMRTR